MYAGHLGPGMTMDLEPMSPNGVDVLFSHQYVYARNNPVNRVMPSGTGGGPYQKSSTPVWPPVDPNYPDPEDPAEARKWPFSCDLYVAGAYDDKLPMKKFFDFCSSRGATIEERRCSLVDDLCSAIEKHGKASGPFCRITIAGHCGLSLGHVMPGVMCRQNDRFECATLTPRCAAMIRRALIPGGTLRLCTCGYRDASPTVWDQELRCIAAKIGSGVRVCACEVKQSLYVPPDPNAGTQEKICTCSKWKCEPKR